MEVLVGVAAAVPGAVVAGVAPFAVVVPGAPLLARMGGAVAAAGCRISDGVRIHSHASKAQPPMRAQRDAGSVRTALPVAAPNLSQFDL